MPVRPGNHLLLMAFFAILYMVACASPASEPSLEPMPEATATAAPSLPSPTPEPPRADDPGSNFLAGTADILESGQAPEALEAVNRVSFAPDGTLEIELKTSLSSADELSEFSYQIIQLLSNNILPTFHLDILLRFSGGNEFKIKITALSADGEQRYESITPYEVMEVVFAKTISLEEWVARSNAGLK